MHISHALIFKLDDRTRTWNLASVNIQAIYCMCNTVQLYSKRVSLRKIPNNTAQQCWRKSHLNDWMESKSTSFYGLFWEELPFLTTPVPRQRNGRDWFAFYPNQNSYFWQWLRRTLRRLSLGLKRTVIIVREIALRAIQRSSLSFLVNVEQKRLHGMHSPTLFIKGEDNTKWVYSMHRENKMATSKRV